MVSFPVASPCFGGGAVTHVGLHASASRFAPRITNRSLAKSSNISSAITRTLIWAHTNSSILAGGITSPLIRKSASESGSFTIANIWCDALASFTLRSANGHFTSSARPARRRGATKAIVVVGANAFPFMLTLAPTPRGARRTRFASCLASYKR